ncbi:MAG TPA: TonB-dependent receptor [Candidatus Binatia bacterium]
MVATLFRLSTRCAPTLCLILVSLACFVIDTALATTAPEAASDEASAQTSAPEAAPEDATASGSDLDASFLMAETVVTGTKTEHPVDETPVPTQVIPRKQIEETATINIEEVLSQIPDLYVQQNQEFGLGASVVRMQGADPNKVAILLDGQRFRGGIDGVVDLRDITTVPIEQVEIIRGPASSLYGSDAMAGVINIRTRAGSPDLSLAATAAGGSFSQQLYNVSHGYHVGPVRYFIAAQHDEVAIAKLFGDISDQYSGERVDDTQKRDSVFVRLDYPTETQSLRITTDYLKKRNPLSNSDDLTNGIFWNWQPFEGWYVDLEGSRYGFQRKNDLEGFVEDNDYADWEAEARVTAPELTLAATRHLPIAGMRFRYETFSAPSQTIGGDDGITAPPIDASATQLSPFLQDEIFLHDQWSLVLGLSLDDHNRYGLEVNPRGTLMWRPTSDLSFGFTAGRGYRAPDLLQLYDIDINNVAIVGNRVTGYAIVGNPNLKAETDVAFNFEASWRPWRGIRSSLVLFRHDFDNLIANVVACPTPTMCNPGFKNPFPDLQGPIFSFDNVSSARTQGFDLGLDFFPLDWIWEQGSDPHVVKLSIAYGFLDSENQSGIPGEDGKQLPFRPKNRAIPSVTYTHTYFGTTLRIWGQWEDVSYADLGNTEEGRIPSHWFWNFKLSQKLPGLVRLLGAESPSWLEGVAVFAQGLNVFDEVLEGVAVAGDARQLSTRATFLGGVTYKF